MKKMEAKLELESKKTMLKNLEREKKLISDQKIVTDKKADFLNREIELVKKQHEYTMRNFVLEKITWAFEKDPEYMDNVKALNQLNFEKKMLEYDVMKSQLEQNEKAVEEQLESNAKYSKEITERIVELEKEVEKDE